MTRDRSEGPSWEELRDWLSVAVDTNETNAALRRFAKGHGFRWFSYLWLQDANIRGISNYPLEWQEHYLAQKLALIDPSLIWRAMPMARLPGPTAPCCDRKAASRLSL